MELIIVLFAIALFIRYRNNKADKKQTERNRPQSFSFKDKITEMTETSYIPHVETSEDYGLYEPRYNFVDSTGYKNKLNLIRQAQKDAIRDKTAVNFFDGWTVDGSKAKGKKMTNGNIKVILRCFNAECEAAINKLTFKNFETTKKRIRSSFEQLNKAFEANKIRISNEYLSLKNQELHLAYEFEKKVQEEKDILREERERQREEKALQKEIDAKKKKIEKEITHRENMLAELKNKIESADESDKANIELEIAKLEGSIKQFEDEQKDLDYRIENAGAGYVYVISNIGAFGEDVVKIGVTRRLEPLDRINELGSASVPFKFDVHALIFSYKAFDLEAALHRKFKDQRINLVNNRKEFFNVPIDTIEAELMKYKDLTIEFHKEVDAEEYRQSLELRKGKSVTDTSEVLI